MSNREKLIKHLEMPIKQEVAKEVDFEQLFDTDYPDQFDQF